MKSLNGMKAVGQRTSVSIGNLLNGNVYIMPKTAVQQPLSHKLRKNHLRAHIDGLDTAERQGTSNQRTANGRRHSPHTLHKWRQHLQRQRLFAI